MQERTFDRLTMTLAGKPTRRGFLRGLGALAAAGFATTAFGQRRTFTQTLARAADDPGEQLVLFFEEIGRIAHEHGGTCAALAKKVRDFEEQHHDTFEQLRAEEATWTHEQHVAHADTYGDRRQVAVDRILAARAHCVFEGDAPGPPAPPPVSFGVSAPLLAGMGSATTRGFAQAATTCTQDNFNFVPSVYCAKVDSDWASPHFHWPAYCSSGNLDGSCDLCAENNGGTSNNGGPSTNPGVCVQYWPQDCQGSDGQNMCELKYSQSHSGLAGAICSRADSAHVFSSPSRCYSSHSDWHSPQFPWDLYCPQGYVDHDCVVCTETGSAANGEVCTEYWPQDCSRPEGNICAVGFNVNETDVCCEKNCPMSTSDCALNAASAFFGDAECGACMLSWCGSTSKCLEYCETNDCCDDACSSAYVPPPPAGEGRTGGTPVSLGTPVTTPATPAIPVQPPTVVPPPSTPIVPPTASPATPDATPVS
jgi:hypothetical protein